MLLAARRVAEGDHLAWAAGRRAAAGRGRRSSRPALRTGRRSRSASIANCRFPLRPATTRAAARPAAPASAPPGRLRACSNRDGGERADRGAVEILARIGQRPRRIAIEPLAMPHLDRPGVAGRVVRIAEAERRRPRPAEQQRRTALRDRPGRASPGSRFRPTGLSVSPTATGRPARSAAIARSTGGPSLTRRARRPAGHGPTAAPTRGTARARGARSPAAARLGEPTYGRAAGRGRSPPSPARDSSTR